MKVGDLIRTRFTGRIGVVLGRATVNGPHPVWFVQVGQEIKKFQMFQMELISESR